MKSIEEIRADLREIRCYYSKRKIIEESLRFTKPSALLNKVNSYNKAIENAPAKLYIVYVSLYIQGLKQVSLAAELGSTPEYAKQLNKRLCEYFQKVLIN